LATLALLWPSFQARFIRTAPDWSAVRVTHMRALSLKNVRFTRQGYSGPSLNGVDLAIETGEFVAVLGRNGSGKSTLAMMMNGLVPHALKGVLEGTVEVFGHNTVEHSVAQLSTLVGMVFQEPETQLFCMSAEEEVAFGPENLAVPHEELASRVSWALETVGLTGYNLRAPSTLSGGEMQRLAIAAAISMRPRMIVLDEPAYALDPVGRLRLYALLRVLRDRYGMTIVVAERDAEDVAQYCDRMVILSQGRVVRDATPSELFAEEGVFASNGLAEPQLARLSALLRRDLPGANLQFTSVDEATHSLSNLHAGRSAGGDAK